MISQATELHYGRQKLYFDTLNGTDLPGTVGNTIAYSVGDQVWNLAPVVGQPGFWTVSAVTATTVTWIPGAILGSSTSRTSAVSTTLLPTDSNLVITDASASVLTLPLASTMPLFVPFNIMVTGAGTCTITPTSPSTINGTTTLAVTTNTGVTIQAISATQYVTV